jgi:two-component system sensor histidine kinase ComP
MEIHPERNYPKIITVVTSSGFIVVFTLLALCFTIFYNIAYFLYVPATGVWLDYADHNQNSAVIDELIPDGPGEKAGLQVGDRIVTIDGREINNLNIPIHQPKKAGQIELYVVQRGDQTLSIPLKVESYFDHLDYLVDIVPLQLLSLLIFFSGALLLFFSPTSDIRARLVALVWVLAGLAVAATGPGYISCAWFAPNIAMLTFAISIFISTTAHLYFPVPTFSNRTRNFIVWVLFGLSVVLIIAYLLQQIYFSTNNLNPPTSITVSAINYPFYLSWLLNIGLLLKNRFFVKDRDIKRQTGIIFLGTLIGFLPFLLFTEIPYLIFGIDSEFILLPSNISILFLIFVPISYGYVIYQRKLLKIDFIINRALVLFMMILAILFASLTVLGLISIALKLPSQIAIFGSLLSVLIALPSASLQKSIQIQVDRALYGGYYDYTTVTSDFSNRLAQTIDRPTFISLLTNELPEKMKIENSAILLLADDNLELENPGIHTFSLSVNDEICEILSAAHAPVRAQNLWNLAHPEAFPRWKQFSWAQIFVPIVHRDTLYGILILGARVTGDIYSNQDLQIIGTVGQQAALSIANITLVEALRGLAQQLVRSDEEQRKRVARDLHDSVLQNLFFIKQRLSRSDPDTASFVDTTITMLRETIKAQRPSLLDGGLILALQDLISDMEQLADDNIVILWHNELESDPRLSDEQATSIYRIVQESLSNVLKHSQADKAIVTAKMENGYLKIQVEDNGIGISSIGQARLGSRYGLLGMRERATMIGADMNISYEPGKGTTVTLKMKL